jgi:ATP-dependent DNA ligase
LRYIYPPRPESRIIPSALAELEKSNQHLVQRKFNGDRCVAAIDAGSASHLSNRHGKWHSKKHHKELRKELLRLKIPSQGVTYVDGELLKSGVFVMFDLLQLAGSYMIGKSQVERLLILDRVSKNPKRFCDISQNGIPLAFQVSDHIWLAQRWESDFVSHFDECIGHDLIEGLVVRKKDSSLDNWGSNAYSVDWQIRCRKPSKKYRY